MGSRTFVIVGVNLQDVPKTSWKYRARRRIERIKVYLSRTRSKMQGCAECIIMSYTVECVLLLSLNGINCPAGARVRLAMVRSVCILFRCAAE